MAKAQTDIRTTSYDALAARPEGYRGSIDSVIAQIRGEGGYQSRPTWAGQARYDLLNYLGVDKSPSAGPSVELDAGIWYGEPDDTLPKLLGIYDPGFYSTANAKARGWL